MGSVEALRHPSHVRTKFPDWAQLLQISVTSLPQLKAWGKTGSAECQFELLGREGATYEIQVSSDFRTWNSWLTTNTTSSVRFSDPASTVEGHRFYRALSH